MSLTLSPDEIYQITGKTQPAAQLRHLRRMGIKAERSDNPDQPVCVCREWLSVESKADAESKPRLKSDRGQTAQA
jgi:hypothetical protein